MGIAAVRSTTKEFFNQEEYRTLWWGMSSDDAEQQFRNRLEALELGLSLPPADERMYFKWLKQISDPAERAKAMVLLQRTQELTKSDWEALRADAIARFGSVQYAQMLEEVGNTMNPIPRPVAPPVGPQNILLAALKAEENRGGEGLEDQIPNIIQSIRSKARFL
jgi:hypothetical protein